MRPSYEIASKSPHKNSAPFGGMTLYSAVIPRVTSGHEIFHTTALYVYVEKKITITLSEIVDLDKTNKSNECVNGMRETRLFNRKTKGSVFPIYVEDRFLSQSHLVSADKKYRQTILHLVVLSTSETIAHESERKVVVIRARDMLHVTTSLHFFFTRKIRTGALAD